MQREPDQCGEVSEFCIARTCSKECPVYRNFATLHCRSTEVGLRATDLVSGLLGTAEKFTESWTWTLHLPPSAEIHIEITHKNMHRDSSARLVAYCGSRSLKSAPTRAQHTRPWASSKVISDGIKGLAKQAYRCSERECQAEPTQQESSEQQGFQGGPCSENAGRVRSCCESSRSAKAASSSRNKPSTGWDAARCQPRVLSSCGSTRIFSMEQAVPGREFKANGGQRVAGSLQWQQL